MNNTTFTRNGNMIALVNTNATIELNANGEILFAVTGLSKTKWAQKMGNPDVWENIRKHAETVYVNLCDYETVTMAKTVANYGFSQIQTVNKFVLRTYKQNAAKAFRELANIFGVRSVGAKTCKNAVDISDDDITALVYYLYGNNKQYCTCAKFTDRLLSTIRFLFEGGKMSALSEQDNSGKKNEKRERKPTKREKELQEKIESMEKAEEEARKNFEKYQAECRENGRLADEQIGALKAQRDSLIEENNKLRLACTCNEEYIAVLEKMLTDAGIALPQDANVVKIA